MKFQDWLWNFTALVFIGPVLLILAVDPDWLARIFGLSIFFLGTPLVGLFYVFGPVKYLGSEGKTIWPKYIIRLLGDKVYLGTKVIIFFSVSLVVYFLSAPFFIDVYQVINKGSPLTRTSIVEQTSVNAITGLISKEVELRGSSSNSKDVFNSLFFSLVIF